MSGNEVCFTAAYTEFMQTQGYKIVLPAANELQIDIDTVEMQERFNESVGVFFQYITPEDVKETPSESGLPCKHITIKLPFDVTVWQRLALQAALGSDNIREILSCIQHLNGDPTPTCFKEVK